MANIEAGLEPGILLGANKHQKVLDLSPGKIDRFSTEATVVSHFLT